MTFVVVIAARSTLLLGATVSAAATVGGGWLSHLPVVTTASLVSSVAAFAPPLIAPTRPASSLVVAARNNRRRRWASSLVRARRTATTLPYPLVPPLRSSSSEEDKREVEYVKADDGEALQALFARQCDEDGLMTKEALKAVPVISELLADGELLSTELDDIWDAAPKFPDENLVVERIDVDSFVQVYRDIDDLFEDEDDDEEGEKGAELVAEKAAEAADPLAAKVDETILSTDEEEGEKGAATSVEAAAESTGVGGVFDDDNDVEGVDENDNEDDDNDDDDDVDETTARDERELAQVFETLCEPTTKLVSYDALRKWDEVSELIQEGMLGQDEFDDMWDRTAKAPGSVDGGGGGGGGSGTGLIDVEGFLSFNVALDDLFVFEDDEVLGEDGEVEEDEKGGNDADDAPAAPSAPSASDRRRPMVEGDDLPPAVIFSQLADDNYLVKLEDLKRWGELQEMLSEGELLPIELSNTYAGIPKAPGTSDQLNEEGFLALYDAIDALFEDDDDEDDDAAAKAGGEEQTESSDAGRRTRGGGGDVVVDYAAKEKLFALLEDIHTIDDDRLPCGLECTEREQGDVLNAVEELESKPYNRLVATGGNVEASELAGSWDLLYTSSSTMKYNQGLSGLAGGLSKFGGLQQKLEASKYLSDVEYIEKVVVNPGGNSFEVRVTGDWELRKSVSLFTGEPSIVMSVVPEKVISGPTTNKADHWKSLGPMNLLDLTYLDDDVRIMRGNTSTDTLFIFKRSDS